MKLRITTSKAAASGALGLAVVLAAPAFACSPQATLSASAYSASPGTAIEVSGKLFDGDGMPVKVVLADKASGVDIGTLLTVQPATNGTFSETVTIPADTSLGEYLMKARQMSSKWGNEVGRDGILERAFSVVAAGEPQPQPPRVQPGPTDPQPQPQAAQPQPQPQPQTAQPQPAETQQPTTAPATSSPSGPPAPRPAAAALVRRAPQAVEAAAPSAAAPVTPAPAEAAPAPGAAPAPEPPAQVSKATVSSDLWSGFREGSTNALTPIDRPAKSADPTGSFAAGLMLFLGGALALLGGVGVAMARRARVRVLR